MARPELPPESSGWHESHESHGTHETRPAGPRVVLVFLVTGLLTGLVLGAVSGPSLAESAWQRALQHANGWTWTTASARLAEEPLLAAAAARGGLGALPATELLAYTATVDAKGAALTGAAPRRLRFAAGETPPADAFWTLTVYRADGSLAPASDGPRTFTSDRSALRDGPIEFQLVREPPEVGRPWLVVPRGPYQLVLRLYRPGADALDGRWRPPAVLEPAP